MQIALEAPDDKVQSSALTSQHDKIAHGRGLRHDQRCYGSSSICFVDGFTHALPQRGCVVVCANKPCCHSGEWPQRRYRLSTARDRFDRSGCDDGHAGGRYRVHMQRLFAGKKPPPIGHRVHPSGKPSSCRHDRQQCQQRAHRYLGGQSANPAIEHSTANAVTDCHCGSHPHAYSNSETHKHPHPDIWAVGINVGGAQHLLRTQ
jgi:hypothetical protein